MAKKLIDIAGLKAGLGAFAKKVGDSIAEVDEKADKVAEDVKKIGDAVGQVENIVNDWLPVTPKINLCDYMESDVLQLPKDEDNIEDTIELTRAIINAEGKAVHDIITKYGEVPDGTLLYIKFFGDDDIICEWCLFAYDINNTGQSYIERLVIDINTFIDNEGLNVDKIELPESSAVECWHQEYRGESLPDSAESFDPHNLSDRIKNRLNIHDNIPVFGVAASFVMPLSEDFVIKEKAPETLKNCSIIFWEYKRVFLAASYDGIYKQWPGCESYGKINYEGYVVAPSNCTIISFGYTGSFAFPFSIFGYNFGGFSKNPELWIYTIEGGEVHGNRAITFPKHPQTDFVQQFKINSNAGGLSIETLKRDLRLVNWESRTESLQFPVANLEQAGIVTADQAKNIDFASKLQETYTTPVCVNDILGDEPYEFGDFERMSTEQRNASKTFFFEKLVACLEELEDTPELIVFRTTSGCVLGVKAEDLLQLEYWEEDYWFAGTYNNHGRTEFFYECDLRRTVEEASAAVFGKSLIDLYRFYTSMIVASEAEQKASEVEQKASEAKEMAENAVTIAFSAKIPLQSKAPLFGGVKAVTDPTTDYKDVSPAEASTVYYSTNHRCFLRQWTAGGYAYDWPGSEIYGKRVTQNGHDCVVPYTGWLYYVNSGSDSDTYMWNETSFVNVNSPNAKDYASRPAMLAAVANSSKDREDLMSLCVDLLRVLKALHRDELDTVEKIQALSPDVSDNTIRLLLAL